MSPSRTENVTIERKIFPGGLMSAADSRTWGTRLAVTRSIRDGSIASDGAAGELHGVPTSLGRWAPHVVETRPA
jgi:hypothetical protein